ncbi:hypothetical protein [Micromonospora sp. WMMD708]|uniref:hypothetical protein n=1 Tax=Micromonospora sp. WMMD708 TaxID=3403464 RepID=UPI003BF56156
MAEATEDLDPGELVADVNGRSGDLGGDGLHPDRWVPDLAGSAFIATQVRPAALHPLITATTDDDRAVVWGREIGRALQDGSLWSTPAGNRPWTRSTTTHSDDTCAGCVSTPTGHG